MNAARPLKSMMSGQSALRSEIPTDPEYDISHKSIRDRAISVIMSSMLTARTKAGGR